MYDLLDRERLMSKEIGFKRLLIALSIVWIITSFCLSAGITIIGTENINSQYYYSHKAPNVITPFAIFLIAFVLANTPIWLRLLIKRSKRKVNNEPKSKSFKLLATLVAVALITLYLLAISQDGGLIILYGVGAGVFLGVLPFLGLLLYWVIQGFWAKT